MFQITLDYETLLVDQWYLLVLRQRDQEAELMLYDQTFNVTDYQEGPLFEGTNEDFNAFYEPRNPRDTIDIYIGINENERDNGFEGSIR